MAISTEFSRRFALEYPIASAPMGGVAGGSLAAAVSNAGAFGFVGGGYGDAEWLRRELRLVTAATSRPWGVGFITWSLTPEAFDLALGFKPHAVMLSFGDPAPWARRIKECGCVLMCQVQDLESAATAVDTGADLIVAQGSEAGGHTGQRSTLSLVPAVVDRVAPTPVLAAGGIGDGRGLAAALALGADGGLIGTRFYASEEALGHPLLKQELVARDGDDTTRTQIFDILRGYPWPKRYAGRAIENAIIRRWRGLESQLSLVAEGHRQAFREATARGDSDNSMVWAGEAIDLIDDIRPAADLVRAIAVQAEAAISKASSITA
ncbi:MAG: NAD(P)H-dependent flavin oxidoreductase [Armatimonadota bacterium]